MPPAWHVAPTVVQSEHMLPPMPQAVSNALVLQVPLVSQHPAHEVELHPPRLVVMLSGPSGPSELPSATLVPTPELSPTA